MSIEKLSQGDPTVSAQVPFYDPINGQDRRCSVTDLLELLTSQAAGVVTQYAAPGASGFSVTISPPVAGTSMFLLLSPGGAYAAGTIVLPSAIDGQEIAIHSRQAVTTLTVTPATGDSLSGSPTTIAAGGFFKLRYDGVLDLWCRVG